MRRFNVGDDVYHHPRKVHGKIVSVSREGHGPDHYEVGVVGSSALLPANVEDLTVATWRENLTGP